MKVEIDEKVSLTVDKAIPCGLIVNELVSNALSTHLSVGPKGQFSYNCARTRMKRHL